MLISGFKCFGNYEFSSKMLLVPSSFCRLDICSQLLGMYQKSHPSGDFTLEAEQYDDNQRLRVSRLIRFWNTAILFVVSFFGQLSKNLLTLE